MMYFASDSVHARQYALTRIARKLLMLDIVPKHTAKQDGTGQAVLSALMEMILLATGTHFILEQFGEWGQPEYYKKHFRVSAFGAWSMFAALQDVAYELPKCKLVRMERLGGFNISNCGWSKRLVDKRIEPNWLVQCPDAPWDCPVERLRRDRSLKIGSPKWIRFVNKSGALEHGTS